MKFPLLISVFFILASMSLQSQWGKGDIYTDNLTSIVELNSVLYAVLNDTLSVSADKGASWSIVEELKDYTVRGLCVSGQKILVFANDSFLIKSYDNGKSWQKNKWNEKVRRVKSFGDTVFVFEQANELAESVVKMSTDAGENWRIILRDVDFLRNVLLERDGIIICGKWMFRMHGNDTKFTKYYPIPISVYLQKMDDTIFAAGGNQIKKSTDYGLTWEDVKTTTSYIVYFAIHKGMIYACTENRILVSSNNGKSWENKYLKNVQVNSVNFLSDVLILGTNYSGMIRTSDNGLSWKNVGLRSALMTNLYAVKNSVGILGSYWRSSDRGKTWYINENPLNPYPLEVLRKDSVLLSKYARYRSSDAGVTWSETIATEGIIISDNGKNLIGFKPVPEKKISEIYESTDLGVTWNFLDNASYEISETVTDGENLYAALDLLAYKSTDQGRNWSLMSYNNVLKVFCSGGSVFVVYRDASTDKVKIKKSSDQGETWFPLTNLVGNIGKVFNSEGYILCVNGIVGKGVILEISTDNGVSWYNIPFEEKFIECNNITVSGNRAYLSTNKGLLYLDLEPLANIWEEEKQPVSEQRIAISPNPSSHTINIRNTLGSLSGKIKVFSILGVLVFERDIDQDSDRYELNVHNLENGVYYISTNDGMFTGSFTITH